jgi:hypothetical protein
MIRMKKIVTITILLLNAIGLFAQEQAETVFRQSGKIYVVVVVMSVIMLGIILFLIRLDRKIKKIEDSKK